MVHRFEDGGNVLLEGGKFLHGGLGIYWGSIGVDWGCLLMLNLSTPNFSVADFIQLNPASNTAFLWHIGIASTQPAVAFSILA